MTDVALAPGVAVLIRQPGLLESTRKEYFSTPSAAVVTIVCSFLIGATIWTLFRWAFFDAVWSSGGPEVCQNAVGACWAVISARWRLIFFGLYPYDEQWRSATACAAIMVTVVTSCIPFFWSANRLPLVWLGGYALFYALMRGGFLGLVTVLETQWGGLALTLFVFATVVVTGMPLAICLALLRRSRLPVIARTTAAVIDAIRSLPLVAILFTAAIVLPYALPQFLLGDKLYRVIAGFSLFFAVYQAEIIRGGMQALPAGQEEAANALGLTYWHTMSRIVLPQAFRYALPPTINQIVITFMETSLIVIIGFFEVMSSGNAAFSTAEWSANYVEVYVFLALIYFTFTFTLSRYGAYLEHRLKVANH